MSDSSDNMDCSLPGSSIHGIFQAKVLEWGAIAFSGELDIVLGVPKRIEPHSSTFAWKILWVEEPGRLQSMRSLRVGHD